MAGACYVSLWWAKPKSNLGGKEDMRLPRLSISSLCSSQHWLTAMAGNGGLGKIHWQA